MRSSQSDWLNTRLNLLRGVKKRVRVLLGEPAKEIQLYSQKYDREFNKKWRKSSKNELLQGVLKSQIVFAADFHAHAQAQRTHLRILRSLPEDRKVILGLECVDVQHQHILDNFVSGKVSEKSFLKQVKWKERWGFNWDHYKPLFDFARERKLRVIALNKPATHTTRKSLSYREKNAAVLISKVALEDSQALIYIIFGEFHLAPKHLPQAVFNKLNAKPKHIIIYQNSEKIYFKLAKKNQENETDVVKISNNQYCIINSPPWVKWQSYLIFLEKKLDFDLDDIDGGSNYYDLFISQLRLLGSEFNLATHEDELNLCMPGDWSASKLPKLHSKNQSESKLIKQFILSEKGFIFAKHGIVYIPRLSLNHLATLVGQWLLVKNANATSPYWNLPKDFERLIFFEAIGFFASKLINPGRKQDTLEDLMLELKNGKQSQIDVLKLCLSYKRQELLGSVNVQSVKLFKARHKSSYHEAAKKLGALLGEQMFWGYRKGKLHRTVIREWFCIPLDSDNFLKFYREQVRLLNQLPVVVKNKRERL